MLVAQSSCRKLSVHGSQIGTYMDRHIIMEFGEGREGKMMWPLEEGPGI